MSRPFECRCTEFETTLALAASRRPACGRRYRRCGPPRERASRWWSPAGALRPARRPRRGPACSRSCGGRRTGRRRCRAPPRVVDDPRPVPTGVGISPHQSGACHGDLLQPGRARRRPAAVVKSRGDGSCARPGRAVVTRRPSRSPSRCVRTAGADVALHVPRGITPARGPMVMRCLIARAHGRIVGQQRHRGDRLGTMAVLATALESARRPSRRSRCPPARCCRPPAARAAPEPARTAPTQLNDFRMRQTPPALRVEAPTVFRGCQYRSASAPLADARAGTRWHAARPEDVTARPRAATASGTPRPARSAAGSPATGATRPAARRGRRP